MFSIPYKNGAVLVPPLGMPTVNEHTHHLRIRSTSQQLEMNHDPRGSSEDYDDKLQAAQVQLEQLQQQREELERKKREVETLTLRKREFVGTQVELTERLGATLTRIDREVFEMRREIDDLEQCRTCFAGHLAKLEKINPEGWTSENLSAGLERAMAIADHADDEYAQAADHFSRSRSGPLFQGGRARRMSNGEFTRQFKNGLAFNLPVVGLGALALLVYLIK